MGALRLDVFNRAALVSGKRISLREIEFKILKLLVENSGNICTREALSRAAWGEESGPHRNLDPHVSELRKKLKQSKVELKTAYGLGYLVVAGD